MNNPIGGGMSEPTKDGGALYTRGYYDGFEEAQDEFVASLEPLREALKKYDSRSTSAFTVVAKARALLAKYLEDAS